MNFECLHKHTNYYEINAFVSGGGCSKRRVSETKDNHSTVIHCCAQRFIFFDRLEIFKFILCFSSSFKSCSNYNSRKRVYVFAFISDLLAQKPFDYSGASTMHCVCSPFGTDYKDVYQRCPNCLILQFVPKGFLNIELSG